MSGMDGARASARRAAAGKPKWECVCGRTVRSNVAIRSHLKACEVSLREQGWPIDDGMRAAAFQEYGLDSVRRLRYIALGLGQVYLARRAAGDKTELSWRDYRDLFWRLGDEAAANKEEPK